ncbi:MAG: helix-turn-helix transcriptional regulator [Bacteroidaceae bacterium]|nr:helix-turn-helix transcriptional regulator [Bacteroidaceae bacterium]
MKSKAVQFLESHQSGDTSAFEADAQWRRENASWLKRSRSVAMAIIDYMQDNGLSRNDVAEKLQVTPQYVSKILSGKVNFSFKSVAEIEERLGVDCFRAAAVGV